MTTENFIDPEGSTPKSHADELFVHGLMTQLQDTPAAREQRIQSVLANLEGKALGRPSRFNLAARYPRFVRISLAAAASLALLVSMTYIGIGTEKSADATVQASIAAMRSPGERRFEVRAKLETDSDLGKEPMAVIDSQANQMLLRAKGPDNHGITVGRDSEGAWAIRRDGSIERENPEARWPRWAMLGDESLFADSVDQLLETMSQGYDIKKSGSATLTDHGEKRYAHLSGVKRRPMQPGPKQIDLWIDESSNMVERMEMHFERPPQNQPGGPGPEGRGPRGEGGPQNPGDRPGGLGGPGPLGPPDRGPGGHPFGPPNGPRNGHPDGPPPDGALGPGERPEHPPGDGPEGQPRGENGPIGGEKPVLGGGPGPSGPRGGPLGRLDPRRGPRGEHLPPLELLVIERVTPPMFGDDYFKAETYSTPATTEPAKK